MIKHKATIRKVLKEVIDVELEEFKKKDNAYVYKVRPSFSDDKFYLTLVQGDFESSLACSYNSLPPAATKPGRVVPVTVSL